MNFSNLDYLPNTPSPSANSENSVECGRTSTNFTTATNTNDSYGLNLVNNNNKNINGITNHKKINDSGDELTCLSWLFDKTPSLTWPNSVKPILDDDLDDDKNFNANGGHINNQSANSNLMVVNNCKGKTQRTLNGNSLIHNNSNNNTSSNNNSNNINSGVTKKQSAADRFNKFIEQVKKTKIEYDSSDRIYQLNADEKPPFNYSQIIGMAMLENGRMTLQQICNWIQSKFAYYKSRGHWNNSIRHNLSLQFCFRKIDRNKYEKGKGGYWELAMDIAKSERKRIRNRKSKLTNIVNPSTDSIEDYQQLSKSLLIRKNPNQRPLKPHPARLSITNNSKSSTKSTTIDSTITIPANQQQQQTTLQNTTTTVLTSADSANCIEFPEIISVSSEMLHGLNLSTFGPSGLTDCVLESDGTNHQLQLQHQLHQQTLHQEHEHANNSPIPMEINLNGEIVPIINNNNHSTGIKKLHTSSLAILSNNNNIENCANNRKIDRNSTIQLHDVFMVANDDSKNNNKITICNSNSNNNSISNAYSSISENNDDSSGNSNEYVATIIQNGNEFTYLNSDSDGISNNNISIDNIDSTTHNVISTTCSGINCTNTTTTNTLTILSSGVTHQQQDQHQAQQILDQQQRLEQNEMFEDEFEPGTIVDPTTMEIQLGQLKQEIYMAGEIPQPSENIVVTSFLNNSPINGPNVIVEQLPNYYPISLDDKDQIISNHNYFSPNSTSIQDEDDDDNDLLITNQFCAYFDGIDKDFQFLKSSENQNRGDELLDGLDYDISVSDF